MSALSWIKEMLVFNRLKDITIQRLLTVLVLAGAIYAAYNASGVLTWLGVAYYILCIAALLLLKHPRVRLLLWFAVFAHTLLVGYSLWEWKTEQIIPCVYCFSAAFLALIAAVLLYRLPAAIVPVILFAGMLYAWPYAFAVAPENVVTPAASNIEESQPTIANIEASSTGDSAQSEYTGTGQSSATGRSNTLSESTKSNLLRSSPPKEASAPKKETLPVEEMSSQKETTLEGNSTEVSGQKSGNDTGGNTNSNSTSSVEPDANPKAETNTTNGSATTQPKPKSG